MSVLSNKCEICYQETNETDPRKYCNNCGNDYHELCIGQVADNKCPNCREQFSNTIPKKPESRTFPITPTREKEEGGIQWWGAFIIFEVINFGMFLKFLGDGDPFLQSLGLFVIISFVMLFISPLAAWKWRSYGF